MSGSRMIALALDCFKVCNRSDPSDNKRIAFTVAAPVNTMQIMLNRYDDICGCNRVIGYNNDKRFP